MSSNFTNKIVFVNQLLYSRVSANFKYNFTFKYERNVLKSCELYALVKRLSTFLKVTGCFTLKISCEPQVPLLLRSLPLLFKMF